MFRRARFLGLAFTLVCAIGGARIAGANPPRRLLRDVLEQQLLAQAQTPAERAAISLKMASLPIETMLYDGSEPQFQSRPSNVLSCTLPCTTGTLEADSPYYDVFLNCGDGAYTARTGASHSVTALGGGP